jgi:DnaJ family protein C protein 28
MKHWESLVDRKIREAMNRGEFDDLPGKGEPVDLSENPFEDPELRLAHRTLRNAGFAPSWIEERKDIEAELVLARNNLERAWSIFQRARGTAHESGASDRREKATASFRQLITQLNRRIAAWNLKVPTAAFQRTLINAETEIEAIRGSSQYRER